MRSGVSLIAVGHATSLTLAVTFSLCVSFDLLFPEHAMYNVWLDLLPGFEWINWKTFLIGLAESWLYGWYFALIWVPTYNSIALRNRSNDKDVD